MTESLCADRDVAAIRAERSRDSASRRCMLVVLSLRARCQVMDAHPREDLARITSRRLNRKEDVRDTPIASEKSESTVMGIPFNLKDRQVEQAPVPAFRIGEHRMHDSVSCDRRQLLGSRLAADADNADSKRREGVFLTHVGPMKRRVVLDISAIPRPLLHA